MNKLAPRMATERTPGTVLRPVVALDIDGTLGNWHDDFLQFAWKWLYGVKKMAPEHWYMYDGTSLNVHMGVTKEQYRAVKLAYRQSGLKRDMHMFHGADELVRRVRNAGAEVWVCTTRPYLRLDNIDPDTREWLERNNLRVDGVIFGEHKYVDLCGLVDRERIVGVLDDLPEMVQQAQTQGLPAMLIQRHHNQEWWAQERGRLLVGRSKPLSLPHLHAAQEWLLAEIKDWKVKNDVI
jgi:hypothetical protein